MTVMCNIEHEFIRCSTGRHAIQLSDVFYCPFSPGNSRNGRHRHQCYEACLVLEGSGIFHCGGINLEIKPNSIFIAAPNIEHEIISRDSDWLKLSFFTFAIVPEAADYTTWTEQDDIIGHFLRSHQPVVHDCGYLACHADFQRNYQLSGGRTAARRMALLMLLDYLEAFAREKAGEPVKNDQPLASRIAAYVQHQVQQGIDVETLCQYAHMSQRSLYLLFETHFQMPPARYINHIRIQASIGYLNMGFSIKSVADLMGFADLSTFSRLFRKVTGKSPRHYLAAGEYGNLVRQP